LTQTATLLNAPCKVAVSPTRGVSPFHHSIHHLLITLPVTPRQALVKAVRREQACAEALEGQQSVLKAMYCFFKGKERKRTMQIAGWIRCCELLGWTGRDRDGDVTLGLSYTQVSHVLRVPSSLLTLPESQ
jgi:hypothetical protein